MEVLYKHSRAAEGDSNWAIWRTGIPDPGIHRAVLSNVTGLKSKTNYQFRVYARNISGTSEKVTRTATTDGEFLADGPLTEDRFEKGIGIGISIALPIVILLSILLVIMSRRNRGKGEKVPGTQTEHTQSIPYEATEPRTYSSLNQQISENNEYERIQLETCGRAFTTESEHPYRNMTVPYQK
ncbi:uncharacterized protein LOC124260218 [Haliotis rubra]|uniref:uncharacterized protein LOC124260218 n=1 Tax=Haliotis rubra TaxID=36100 RepID=UPI001EE599E5|nr:uncharacterized protein LOC124260218 [Haliotis rubra]